MKIEIKNAILEMLSDDATITELRDTAEDFTWVFDYVKSTVYHRRSNFCIPKVTSFLSKPQAVSHHAAACISLMIFRNELQIISHAFALIFCYVFVRNSTKTIPILPLLQSTIKNLKKY